MLGNPTITPDVSEEHESGFGSLKDVLEAIHNDHKVCSRPRAQTPTLPTHLQSTATETNKIEGLRMSIVGLETHFNSLPGTLEEQRIRHQLIRYIIVIPFLLSVDFLSASSRISKKNSDHYLRHTTHRSLFILPKATEKCSDTSKTYERLYSITRFVYDSVSLADVYKDNS